MTDLAVIAAAFIFIVALVTLGFIRYSLLVVVGKFILVEILLILKKERKKWRKKRGRVNKRI